LDSDSDSDSEDRHSKVQMRFSARRKCKYLDINAIKAIISILQNICRSQLQNAGIIVPHRTLTNSELRGIYIYLYLGAIERLCRYWRV